MAAHTCSHTPFSQRAWPSVTRPRAARPARPRAAWGEEPAWQEARVATTSQAAIGLVKLTVDIGDLAGGYKRAGQFLQIKVGDSKPAFMAIASAPSTADSRVELLVKNSGDTAVRLCEARAGDSVSVSPVMGKGFPVERIPVPEVDRVVACVTGTGMAPVKALIESGGLQARERKLVRLYYGTFNPESTAYSALEGKWAEAGVEVVHAYSGLGQGYVQDLFRKDADQLVTGASTGGLVVGQKEMASEVRQLLTERGVLEERILSNY